MGTSILFYSANIETINYGEMTRHLFSLHCKYTTTLTCIEKKNYFFIFDKLLKIKIQFSAQRAIHKLQT